MKSISGLLHRTSWPLLLGGGLVVFIALAIFTAPLHTMRLEKSGATPEENRAIKSEINTAFSEGVIDVARDIVQEVRDRTKDPERRAELDSALADIDEARRSLKEAGAEVLRAKRDALDGVSSAVKDATDSIQEAKRQAASALKDSHEENQRIQKSLDDSLDAAKKAEAEARDTPEGKSARKKKPRVIMFGPHPDEKPLLELEIGKDGVHAPATPLSPQAKQEIRRKISGDLYRVGIGASLILVFIPLFVIAIVAKFFIGRSRAALAVADTKKREAEYHRMSQQVTEAKLSALQAQVEPHFLYNTLASVQALTEVDPARANEMTGHLIQYLRNALPKMRESVSTVGQEVELVRAYLNILQMRMGKRLAFEIDVPAELADLPFPPLMLPSLVENAIKHGLEPQREGGVVVIRAVRVDDTIRMTVSDTGKGFSDTPGSGVGLTNIRERLAALYGSGAKLTLEAQEPHGVVATLEVPAKGREAAPAGSAPAWAAASGLAPPMPEAAKSAAARTLAVMGSAERAWRKGLSFAFIVLVCIAGVVCGLAMVGVATGLVPIQIGDQNISGAPAALIGTAGIAAAFAVLVLALAIVLALVYGLGFLFVGIAIFVPLVIAVSLFPALAPFILIGLAIWWFVRRRRRKADEAAAASSIPSSVPQEIR